MSLAHYAKALGGQAVGRSRVMCPGPGHSPNDRSLSVTFGSGGFIVYSFAGDDWQTCRDHVRDLLGMRNDRTPRLSADDLDRVRREDEQEAIRLERRAIECWKASQEINGTIAETYLRNRGITSPLPDTLRFNPECYHPSTKRVPALVALVEGSERFSVHRTYLRSDGSGKAATEPAKAMLGATAGGAVRLTEGGDRIVVCEGIETGLSLASGLVNGSPTILSALSTSGMRGLVLPPVPGSLLIATDGDDPGRAAGNVLAERAAFAGWKVSTLPAPDGRDWNDVLAQKARHA